MMKKTLVTLLACFLLYSVSHAQSLEQGNTRIHTLGSYGLKWKNFGAGAGVEFFFADNFALMPSYTFIFPRVGKASNFSADLRYYLSDGPSQLYLLAGYSQNWENPQNDRAGRTRTAKGANVGIGAYIRIVEWVGISSEFRFQSQTSQEGGFRVGLAFPL